MSEQSRRWDKPPDEMLEAARELSQRAVLLGQIVDHLSTTVDVPRIDLSPLAIAERMLRARRARGELLPAEWFGEQCWDIVLETYVASGRGRIISVSGACAMSGVPATTALRAIRLLVETDWLLRIPDPKDHRRVVLELVPARIETLEIALREKWRRLVAPQTSPQRVRDPRADLVR